MSIPTTFAPVGKQDFTLTPVKVNKSFSYTRDKILQSGSGYTITEGQYTSLITPIGDPKANNDPVNLDGSYKHVVWQGINHLYYRDPYNAYGSFEHPNKRYTFKFLNTTASILSIPYLDHGERLRPGSIKITSGSFTFIDDGYGNLYDSNLETNFIGFSRHNVIGFWGFNSEFRNFKYFSGTTTGNYHYDSYQIDTHNHPSYVYNVTYKAGPSISGSACGMAAYFKNDGTNYSFIRTPKDDKYNFDSSEEFTISFWINPSTQNQTGSVISKNGSIFENTWGYQDRMYVGSGQSSKAIFMSSSLRDRSTDIYPYDFTWHNNILRFKRSDGKTLTQLSCSVVSNQWSHVSVTKYTDGSDKKIKMVVNGGPVSASIVDKTGNCLNDFELMFGSRNQQGLDSFSGSLDEIRFVDKAYYTGSVLDTNFYKGISNYDYMYNTAIIGNVFYRKGLIVLSPLNNKYKNTFNSNFTLNFQSIHRIYEYEVMCRIRKGDFSISTNPTALQSPKSDLLINDMTGSLLNPYATSIGMYNSEGVMIAVAKLGQPVQMRNDVDINIAVRWDG
jgi:hypothetical protein